MIDLHLHTTASDGRCSPRELVDRAAAAGLTIMAATDHDTTDAVHEVQAHASASGIRSIAGIEITAVEGGLDVHVLGYFINPGDAKLEAFLVSQRHDRVARVLAIGSRLAELGYPIDLEPVLEATRRYSSRTVGRPQVARAMVAAGYVADLREAFDVWLGRGCPAFIPRIGASPESVIDIIHAAGGLASLAHPGRTGIDGRITALCSAGLDAIEVFHSDHNPTQVERYGKLAREIGCLMTGGSDFHGEPSRPVTPGCVTLPTDEWERLRAAHDRNA